MNADNNRLARRLVVCLPPDSSLREQAQLDLFSYFRKAYRAYGIPGQTVE
jgi:hypothetical protein